MISFLKWAGILGLIAANIALSFYYSIEMIAQNQTLNSHQNTYNSLFQTNLDLQSQLSRLQSISTLEQYAQGLNLTPIKKSFNLKP